jgi:hypothetical protein
MKGMRPLMKNKASLKGIAGAFFISALLLGNSLPSCAEEPVHIVSNGEALVRQPFPQRSVVLSAKLFELIEPDEAKYDADFSKAFAKLLAPYEKKVPNFRKRVTSGAAADSKYFSGSSGAYVYFSICQAHQCDATTMGLLYSVETKKMVAKILDRCRAEWLGSPNGEEMNFLNMQQAISFPATLSNCGEVK